MAQSLKAAVARPDHQRSMSHGRGGAGNINNNPPAVTEPHDLTTPSIKSQTYTTGRGGQGNMATNDPENPGIARAAQDVDAPVVRAKETSGTYHWGRGGEGNMMTVGEGQKNKKRTGSKSTADGRRGSFADAIEKGREMLGLGKRTSASPKEGDNAMLDD